MSFVSYAQNFEDVMIWRALKHVAEGFYIDVGANDPTLYSVTRAFYDKGWHGINIEPVAEFFDRLKSERPRDINLQIGAGAEAGSFPFFDIPDTGLATSDSEVAKRHKEAGWTVNIIDIPVLPLAEICQKHVHGEIHFLKIDVEGAEKNVLLGMDFIQYRPWLVIVEATIPLSQETAHRDWEHLIEKASYEFVYFDGLNRYYIACEHPELKAAFAVPPNVFDGFVLNADQESKKRVAETEAIAHSARQRAIVAEAQKINAEAKAEASENRAVAADNWGYALADQLNAVHSSTSWRLTLPLRMIKGFLARNKAPQSLNDSNNPAPRPLTKRVVKKIMSWIIVRARHHKLLQKIAERFPKLRRKLVSLAQQGKPVITKQQAIGRAEELPMAARRVFADLQRSTTSTNSK